MQYRSALFLLLICLTSGIALPAWSQIETPVTPPSTRLYSTDPLAPPRHVHKRAPSSSAATVDANSSDDSAAISPFQYGVARPVSISLTQHGRQLRTPDGGTLWRLAITSEQAQALRLIYDAFHLPAGAQLFVYDPDRRVVRGAYTARNNKSDGTFATDFTPGARTVIEYYEPAEAPFAGKIRISDVVHAWTVPRSLTTSAAKSTYEPSALPCSINTTCPSANGWGPEARATVLIDRGGSTCSGVLMNNERGDFTPYVLTAHHCGKPSVGQTVSWIFKFNYASSTCADPAETPGHQSVTGATVRVANGDHQSDILLLELSEPIPPSYEVYFAGWSANGSAPSSAVVMGHPRSDIRKITFEDDPPLDYSTRWIATFDHGTVETGSSGSPLFNENHQVIGHVSSALSLDPSECSGPEGDDNAPQISHPKLSYNWTIGPAGQQLADFLDPDDTGTTSIGGLEGADATMPVELTSFDALRNGSSVVLRWSTASETNNAGFEIQHRPSGHTHWKRHTFVEGRGTTQQPRAYRHSLSELSPGSHSFRLKQVDYDGTFSYSPVVEVSIEASSYQISNVAPHPVRHQSSFTVSVAQSQQVRVDLIDVLGRRVAAVHNGILPAHAPQTLTIPADRLSSGLYLLQVSGETFRTSQKVTVLR